MSLIDFFVLGPIKLPPAPAAKPPIKGKRIEPTVPITSPEFKYTNSVETDLRKKWFGNG